MKSHTDSIALRLNLAETQYIYDLKLPSDFTPTPSDGEAESFEVSPQLRHLPDLLLQARSDLLSLSLFFFFYQLLTIAEVLDNLHRSLFKPNCALGSSPLPYLTAPPRPSAEPPLSCSSALQ